MKQTLSIGNMADLGEMKLKVREICEPFFDKISSELKGGLVLRKHIIGTYFGPCVCKGTKAVKIAIEIRDELYNPKMKVEKYVVLVDNKGFENDMVALRHFMAVNSALITHHFGKEPDNNNNASDQKLDDDLDQNNESPQDDKNFDYSLDMLQGHTETLTERLLNRENESEEEVENESKDLVHEEVEVPRKKTKICEN